ncbi:hypothetical protein AVEN_43407-1 [Araneus ventricosus]|uniref:Uncharacterized protein n=1 Tax=Araneus ventricosus TaxID=182803 RepID=A0A4Y2JI29_ARAVE|nr:hypothetical protein AVEN_43407-1 [Araneus ventricosus]
MRERKGKTNEEAKVEVAHETWAVMTAKNQRDKGLLFLPIHSTAFLSARILIPPREKCSLQLYLCPSYLLIGFPSSFSSVLREDMDEFSYLFLRVSQNFRG